MMTDCSLNTGQFCSLAALDIPVFLSYKIPNGHNRNVNWPVPITGRVNEYYIEQECELVCHHRLFPYILYIHVPFYALTHKLSLFDPIVVL